MDRDSMITIGFAILISLVFILSGSLIKIIPAGHVGVVFNLFGGVEKRILKEGINILFPIVETSTVYDARKIPYTFTDTYERGVSGQSIQCQTNDGQKVLIDLTVIAHLDAEKTWKLHQALGRNYEERLIIPQTRAVLRNVVAKYPIDVVYTTGRKGLAQDAANELKKLFKKSGIILDDLLIRRVQFSETFAEAVERKQIALQESQRQLWIKKTAEREKQRKIIEGEGEAKALAVRGQAIMLDPRISELEFLDQLESSGSEFTVITGSKNTILSIGDLLMATPPVRVGTVSKE